MSPRGAHRLLWLVALLTVPVPFYLGQLETAPVLRLAFLSGLLTAVTVAEGGGVLATFCGLGWLQVLVWAGLLRLGASLVTRLAPDVARTALVGVLVLGLGVASMFAIYDTPLSSSRLHSSLWQLFE